MKKNKEYPATHSMDTAWFACDLDGNIAIFQFEEKTKVNIDFLTSHSMYINKAILLAKLLKDLLYPSPLSNWSRCQNEQKNICLNCLCVLQRKII